VFYGGFGEGLPWVPDVIREFDVITIGILRMVFGRFLNLVSGVEPKELSCVGGVLWEHYGMSIGQCGIAGSADANVMLRVSDCLNGYGEI
jgi:hypothetical protein